MAARGRFAPLVCIVDFHHARGPEVEKWFGIESGHDPVAHNDWSLLPFLALPDGSHASDEEFSYFTLRLVDASKQPASSLFGIACTRHIDSDQLVNKSPDVTRSSVQKAIVAIVDSPYMFARIREKLSAVTKAWFAQKDFSNDEIVEQFYDDLSGSVPSHIEERDQYVGISLRQLVHKYKHQTLILFKCALLQPKMLFFGSDCERLCLLQFALIGLIPGLIRSLQDCADPRLCNYEKTLVTPTSLKTSERASLLKYMGIPLQLFGQGSLFGPYTPLQQLDVLSDTGTKSYIAGSTNSLVLTQKERYSDAFFNLNDDSITLISPTLKNALYLTAADRRWIDFMTQNVNDTWDPEHPTRPKTLGYAGSEEFIRMQFEEYLLALVSSVKYRQHTQKHGNDPKALISEHSGDPATDFGVAFIDAWLATDNYRIFAKSTEPHLFDIVEPKHPCAGGLTVEDVQRRLAQQVAELHLDERLAASRDAVGRTFATGGARVSSAFNTLWSDIEAMREAQRKRASSPAHAPADDDAAGAAGTPGTGTPGAAARAGAYFSSWGAWAAEKRRGGWRGGEARGATPPPVTPAAGERVGEEARAVERVFDAEERASTSRPGTGVAAAAETETETKTAAAGATAAQDGDREFEEVEIHRDEGVEHDA